MPKLKPYLRRGAVIRWLESWGISQYAFRKNLANGVVKPAPMPTLPGKKSKTSRCYFVRDEIATAFAVQPFINITTTHP